MTFQSISQHLELLVSEWENECVEFKEANDNFSSSDIGKYFSALSNEANLRGKSSAWLVFGIRNRDRSIVGTTFRENQERLQSLKKQVTDGTAPSMTFKEIHELTHDGKRVLLFEIPPAPQGMPIGWSGHYYGRAGESLVHLDLAKLDQIRSQGPSADWSAEICDDASIDDLDAEAVRAARRTFAQRATGRISAERIEEWDDATFLEKAKLTRGGAITRTALILLGRPERVHFLSPFVAEMTWKLEGEEKDYEHFHPPFFLTTSRLFQRIRNLKLSFLPTDQLIPIEIWKFDQSIVLEALHNCVAHQDYSKCERILVVETVSGLNFQNAGGFFDGEPSEYFLSEKTPTRYRNRFLAEAMVNLKMIDTMGFGIRDVMFHGQARRFLPLPEYDLTDPDHVRLELPGRFLDENYSRALLSESDLNWREILALDRIQKGLSPDPEVARALKKRKLIEGRKPNWRISASLAAKGEDRATYIRHRAFDDDFYAQLVVEYLREFGQATRPEIDRLLLEKLSSALDEKQKKHKVMNILSKMRRNGLIERTGPPAAAIWRLAASPENPKNESL